MIRLRNECLIREKKYIEKYLIIYFMFDKKDDRFYFKKYFKCLVLKIVIFEDGIV